MVITPYLAITEGEMRGKGDIPSKIAWMACHFSPYTTGLSNMPLSLPENAVLMIDDITPIHRHCPELIADQLTPYIQKFHCRAVLLDFQRTPCDRLRHLAEHLLKALPCPTVIPEQLATDLDCPVFLSPCPPYRPLQAHIEKWQGREIWLEAAKSKTKILLTKNGAKFHELSDPIDTECGFRDNQLLCHYITETYPHAVKFTLWRDSDDLQELMVQAEELGVTETIGLYQELGAEHFSK